MTLGGIQYFSESHISLQYRTACSFDSNCFRRTARPASNKSVEAPGTALADATLLLRSSTLCFNGKKWLLTRRSEPRPDALPLWAWRQVRVGGLCTEKKTIPAFIRQCARHMSHLDARLLVMLTERALKGAEPHKRLPITDTVMNTTDTSNLSAPVWIAWTCSTGWLRSLIH